MLNRIALAAALAIAFTAPACAEKLKVKPVEGSEFEVEIALDAPVADLRRLVAEKQGVETETFRLIVAGKELISGLLSDYNIKDGATIMLVKDGRGAKTRG
jgi:fructose-1,6-bisphosphatase/sedoheptulose 1,7-bisphosphatase-like protein